MDWAWLYPERQEQLRWIVHHPNHGLFIGYAPSTDPKYAISVRIANGYTSGNACLIANDIFKYIFELADKESIITGMASSDTSDSVQMTKETTRKLEQFV